MTDEATPIRVMLVDDHEMVRNGLGTFLLVHDDLELAGEAEDGQQALAVFERVRPDVILMDLKMPRMDGVEAIRALTKRDPDARIIALTSFREEALVQDALDAGALGYLLKDIGADDLAEAIRAAYRGEPTLASEAAWVLFQASRQKSRPGDDLTKREREVLCLIAEGATNPEIADRLFISPSTVKTHVSSILSKLGAATRTEAATRAVQEGLVDGRGRRGA